MSEATDKLPCWIYKSPRKREMYLYVEKKDALKRVPEALLAAFGPPQLAFDLVLSPERKLAREDVDKVLANQGSLMKAARVIPHEEDGRVVGVRLYGIRRTSLLGRLGVRNGDMLRTINGFDMTSPDSALEAYTTLRSADKLTLALKRQNKDMTIDYNIE